MYYKHIEKYIKNCENDDVVTISILRARKQIYVEISICNETNNVSRSIVLKRDEVESLFDNIFDENKQPYSSKSKTRLCRELKYSYNRRVYFKIDANGLLIELYINNKNVERNKFITLETSLETFQVLYDIFMMNNVFNRMNNLCNEILEVKKAKPAIEDHNDHYAHDLGRD